MICSVLNPYPNNNCIDGNNLGEFKFTFCGDYTNSVEFAILDYNNMVYIPPVRYTLGKDSKGFYNGEEVSIDFSDHKLAQNSEYIWYAKLYEKVDFNNGYFPTQYVSSGKFRKCPFEFTSVAEYTEELDDVHIPLDQDIEMETPCYMYYDGSIYEGLKYRPIVSFDKGINSGTTKSIAKLSKAYYNPLEIGEDIVICKYNPSVTHGMQEVKSTPQKCVYVEPNLSFDFGSHKYIDNYNNEDVINNAYLKVNGIYYKIRLYFTRTGVIVLEEDAPAVDETTTYEIYTCVYRSPYYYFTTKAIPTVIPKMEFVNEVIKCTAEITTSGNYSVRYYYWTIYKDGVEVDRSQKIYSGRLEYLFREIESDTRYTGKITVVTQDNVEVTSAETSCSFTTYENGITSLDGIVDETNGAVRLSWVNVADDITGYVILRKKGESVKFLQSLEGQFTEYYDYSCANNAEYEYIIIPKTNTSVYQEKSVYVDVSFDDYFVYFLSEVPYIKPSSDITTTRVFYEYMHGDSQYEVKSIWSLQLNVTFENATHNISRIAENTYKGKPAITYGNMNYDSFTLKFTLGQISRWNCEWEGYEQDNFDLWREQINSKRPVLIKDTKGNVWFGSIMSHSFEIDYDAIKYQPYNITIEFSQERDMDETRIIDG